MELIRITSALPDLSELAAAAATEGHSIVRRLTAEWSSGAERFDRPGEELLAADIDRRIVAVGGITIEPSEATALRMRRFYVLPAYRRRGIARAIAGTLTAARPGVRITVHAGTASAPEFWQRLGFNPIAGQPYSHVLSRPT